MNKEDITKKIGEAKEKSGDRKFKQSVEVSVNFKDINMEDPEYKLNLNVFLPKGRGKEVDIGVFADGDMNIRAKKLSKHVLNKTEIEEYSKNKRKMRKFANSCYAFIAQPELMSIIGRSWGIVLGPRGKMPQPVPANVDLNAVMDKLRNSVKIKSKKNPTIQVPIGAEDMEPGDLADNMIVVMDAIERQIPDERIRSVHIKTTMGSPIKLR
ncbi:MAG: 50S ribosomal protein L1 [Candidatus Altiarchaeota archaeon]|nr:50S ribosomal protein L1 [Candidatus Altiarchaeota archaeon]